MCSAARTFALGAPAAPSGLGRRRIPTPAARRVTPRRVVTVTTAGIGVPLSSGRSTPSEDTASDLRLPVVRPGRYCSPRHKLPFKSRNEGVNCVSVTWRAIYARPYTLENTVTDLWKSASDIWSPETPDIPVEEATRPARVEPQPQPSPSVPPPSDSWDDEEPRMMRAKKSKVSAAAELVFPPSLFTVTWKGRFLPDGLRRVRSRLAEEDQSHPALRECRHRGGARGRAWQMLLATSWDAVQLKFPEFKCVI